MTNDTGWRRDPFGIHEWRYFVDGNATGYVADAGLQSYDNPPPDVNPPTWPAPPSSATPYAPNPYKAPSDQQAPTPWSGVTYRPPFTMPDPVPEMRSAWTTFVSDLGLSWKALVASPLLPVISAAIFLLDELVRVHVPGIGLISIPVALFSIGFTGTIRMWFLRAYRNQPMGLGEVWRFTTGFLGRFLVLGLIFFVPVGVLAGVGGGLWAASHRDEFHRNAFTGTVTVPRSFTVAVVVVIVCMTLVLDVLLTFVVPALAYSTRSAGRAIRIGFRVVRQTWPKCAWYVLAPGLTLGLVAVVLPASVVGTALDLITGLIGVFLALLFKGAIAAFYLRAFPQTGQYGSISSRD